jgi:hypothetical protein
MSSVTHILEWFLYYYEIRPKYSKIDIFRGIRSVNRFHDKIYYNDLWVDIMYFGGCNALNYQQFECQSLVLVTQTILYLNNASVYKLFIDLFR